MKLGTRKQGAGTRRYSGEGRGGRGGHAPGYAAGCVNAATVDRVRRKGICQHMDRIESFASTKACA
jgi:hypothetical protein